MLTVPTTHLKCGSQHYTSFKKHTAIIHISYAFSLFSLQHLQFPSDKLLLFHLLPLSHYCALLNTPLILPSPSLYLHCNIALLFFPPPLFLSCCHCQHCTCFHCVSLISHPSPHFQPGPVRANNRRKDDCNFNNMTNYKR